MLMGKEMLLAILQITPALAAIAESQLGIGDFRPAADGALMLGNPGARPRLTKLCSKLLLAFLVLSCNMNAGKPEKQEHIDNGNN